MLHRTLLSLGIGALAFGVTATAPQGATAADDAFFKDRTVRVVVPSGSGGTYHLYCQILSRHLGRHLGGGTATAVTQNRPGAGGAKAARYMVTAAPKDGSVIAMINPGSYAMPMLRPGIGFDTLKMKWLGTMSGRAYTVGVYYKTGIKTVADATKRVVIMGTTGKASTSYLVPTFMNKTLGTKFKIITGYKGGGAINVAIQRKEIEGRGNFFTGYLGVWPEAVTKHQMNFLVRLGPEREELKNVPKLRDLMTTQRQQEMIDILEISFNVGQAFYAPPGISKARLDALRNAFVATMKDPATKRDTDARHLPLRWKTHDVVRAEIVKVFQKPKAAFDQLANMLGFRKKKS
jgi:tripartite-type tricarboxylate transporter receptor subunit TctC